MDASASARVLERARARGALLPEFRKKRAPKRPCFNRCHHVGRDCRRVGDLRRAGQQDADRCYWVAGLRCCRRDDCRPGARLAGAVGAVVDRRDCRHPDWRGRTESSARCRGVHKDAARAPAHRPGRLDADPWNPDHADCALRFRNCLRCVRHTGGCHRQQGGLHQQDVAHRRRPDAGRAACRRKASEDRRCDGRWGPCPRHRARTSCGTPQDCHQAGVSVPWSGVT